MFDVRRLDLEMSLQAMIFGIGILAASPLLAGAADIGRSGGAAGVRPDETVPPDLGSDPELIAQMEFENALKESTANALCLFVRHHADHPLAIEARRLLWENYRIDGSEEHPCPQANR